MSANVCVYFTIGMGVVEVSEQSHIDILYISFQNKQNVLHKYFKYRVNFPTLDLQLHGNAFTPQKG